MNNERDTFTYSYKCGKKTIPVTVTTNHISDEALKNLANKIIELYA